MAIGLGADGNDSDVNGNSIGKGDSNGNGDSDGTKST